MAALLTFLREQLFTTPTYPEKKHTGETIIVTGANSGLGFEAARHFTRLDAEKVILAVRSTEKGEAAKKSIEESTQRHGVVEVWPMDLCSYESVKQFAKRVEGLKRLDAIVENAGKATRKYEVAEDNESTISRSDGSYHHLITDDEQQPMWLVLSYWLCWYCPNCEKRLLNSTLHRTYQSSAPKFTASPSSPRRAAQTFSRR